MDPDSGPDVTLYITKYRFPKGYHADGFYQTAITDYFRPRLQPYLLKSMQESGILPPGMVASYPTFLSAFVLDLVELECNICRVEWFAPKFQTICKHVFHGRCLFEWLATKHTCPFCRFRLLGDWTGGYRNLMLSKEVASAVDCLVPVRDDPVTEVAVELSRRLSALPDIDGLVYENQMVESADGTLGKSKACWLPWTEFMSRLA